MTLPRILILACVALAASVSQEARAQGSPNGPGTPYCFSNSDCPCGNIDPNAGCANSTSAGAFLSSSGSASASADDLVLTVSNVPPNQFGILFMGGDQVVDRPPFGDGLLCVAPVPVFCRFPVQNSGSSGVMTEGPGIVAFSQTLQPACHIDPGDTWYFQGWYRDPQGPCGGLFNLSNALSVTFAP